MLDDDADEEGDLEREWSRMVEEEGMLANGEANVDRARRDVREEGEEMMVERRLADEARGEETPAWVTDDEAVEARERATRRSDMWGRRKAAGRGAIR